jgi:hypothetical protein
MTVVSFLLICALWMHNIFDAQRWMDTLYAVAVVAKAKSPLVVIPGNGCHG